MRVRELIDILKDQPPDAEVELAVVAPVDEQSDDITVDRYGVEGMLPWTDDDSDEVESEDEDEDEDEDELESEDEDHDEDDD